MMPHPHPITRRRLTRAILLVALLLLAVAVGVGWRYWSRGPGEAARWDSPTGALLTAHILPDGRRAALAERWGKLRILNLQTLQPVEPPLEVDVRKVVVCADGRSAAVCVPEQFDSGEAARLELWDLGTGRLSKAFALSTRDSWLNTPLAIANDASRVLCFNEDELVLFEAASAGPVRRIAIEGPETLTHLAISPDGRHAVGGGSNGVCHVWDLTTGTQLAGFSTGHTAPITALVFSPDGTCIVAAHQSGLAFVWPLSGDKPLAQFSSSAEPFTALAATSGAARVLTGDAAGRVCLWDGRTGKRLARFAWHTGPILCVGFSPDARQAISASEDGTVRLWDLPW